MINWLKFLALAFPLLVSACAGPEALPGIGREQGGENTKGMVASGSPSTPIRVELRMPFAPAVNQEVSVELMVTSAEAVKDVNATIQLPEGVEVVSAQAEQNFDLNAGESRTLSTTIRFPAEGQYQIFGKALSDIGGESVWGDLATIHLTVGVDQSFFGFEMNAEGEAMQAGGAGDLDSEIPFEMPPDCTQPSEDQPGCFPPPTEVTTSDECPAPNSEPATPLSVSLELPETAQANQTVPGTLVVCAIQEAPETQVTLELPDGAELAQGDTTWVVDLSANQPVRYSIELRFAAAGQYQVMAKALYPVAGGTVWGDSVLMMITVRP